MAGVYPYRGRWCESADVVFEGDEYGGVEVTVFLGQSDGNHSHGVDRDTGVCGTQSKSHQVISRIATLMINVFAATTSRISPYLTVDNPPSGPARIQCSICNQPYASFLDSFLVSNWTCILFYPHGSWPSLRTSFYDPDVSTILPFRPWPVHRLHPRRDLDRVTRDCVETTTGGEKWSLYIPFRSRDTFYSTDTFTPLARIFTDVYEDVSGD